MVMLWKVVKKIMNIKSHPETDMISLVVEAEEMTPKQELDLVSKRIEDVEKNIAKKPNSWSARLQNNIVQNLKLRKSRILTKQKYVDYQETRALNLMAALPDEDDKQLNGTLA